jgi:acyl-coenzyme A synthetase/AMP-(fatty) acid ligase
VPLHEISGYLAERVAPDKKVRTLEAVTEIPRSAAGKILRRVLKERQVR